MDGNFSFGAPPQRASHLRQPTMAPSWMKKKDTSDANHVRVRRLTSLSNLFHPRRTHQTDLDVKPGKTQDKRNSRTPHPNKEVLPRGPTSKPRSIASDPFKLRKVNTEASLIQSRIPVYAAATASPKLRYPETSFRSLNEWQLPRASSSYVLIPSASTNMPPPSAFSRPRHTREASLEIVRQSFEEIFPLSRSASPNKGQPMQRSLEILQSSNLSNIGGLDLYTTAQTHQGDGTSFAYGDEIHEEETRQASATSVSPEVYDSQPSAYWCGRFTTLHDALRAMSTAPPLLEESTEQRRQIRSNDFLRAKEVCLRLHKCCKTEAARDSFSAFVSQFAARANMPELTALIPPSEEDH